MNKGLTIVRLITDFPIGNTAQTREELLCKASIISYLSQMQPTTKNISQDEVNKFLSEILALDGDEHLPSLQEAEKTLHLSPGFIQDINKVQLIKESNSNFDLIFNEISSSLSISQGEDTKTI